jgi:hypothetical protein
MNTSLISACMTKPMDAVTDTAENLHVKRLRGESEDTFRHRVAYALQIRMYQDDEKEVPVKVTERAAEYEMKATLENKGVVV